MDWEPTSKGIGVGGVEGEGRVWVVPSRMRALVPMERTCPETVVWAPGDRVWLPKMRAPLEAWAMVWKSIRNGVGVGGGEGRR